LDDFSCNGERFQDGAVTANNPAVVAIQEARLLWPDSPIEVFVSVGTGSTPVVRREKSSVVGVGGYYDTGQILIEGATSVQRVQEALAVMLPLVPDLRLVAFEVFCVLFVVALICFIFLFSSRLRGEIILDIKENECSCRV
jgi:hypothetical protein